MSIFFVDPDEARLPPGEVRLKSVKVTPIISVGRVRIELELTPFQQRPNVDLTITDLTGTEAAKTTILEAMLSKLELTMHIRQPEPGQEYQLDTRVYYQKLPQPSLEPVDIALPDPMVVDQKVTTFTFPKTTS